MHLQYQCPSFPKKDDYSVATYLVYFQPWISLQDADGYIPPVKQKSPKVLFMWNSPLSQFNLQVLYQCEERMCSELGRGSTS